MNDYEKDPSREEDETSKTPSNFVRSEHNQTRKTNKLPDNKKLNSLADELLATSGGAAVGAVGTAIGLAATSTLAPVIGSVVGGVVGLTVMKWIEKRRETGGKAEEQREIR